MRQAEGREKRTGAHLKAGTHAPYMYMWAPRRQNIDAKHLTILERCVVPAPTGNKKTSQIRHVWETVAGQIRHVSAC